MVRAMMMSDQDYMARAMTEAIAAGERGEVPIGAVVVAPETGEVLAADGNRTIELKDPTAHAEILVLRHGARALGNERLTGCRLFVTLEPCAMCAGAISFARIAELIYGATDAKGGAVESGPRFYEQPTCHHRPSHRGGLGGNDAARLLQDFFRARRKGEATGRSTSRG